MFARANVNFKNKYLVTATVRADGSTKFGENNNMATFLLSQQHGMYRNEDFMQIIDFVQNLKFRAGLGSNW